MCLKNVPLWLAMNFVMRESVLIIFVRHYTEKGTEKVSNQTSLFFPSQKVFKVTRVSKVKKIRSCLSKL